MIKLELTLAQANMTLQALCLRERTTADKAGLLQLSSVIGSLLASIQAEEKRVADMLSATEEQNLQEQKNRICKNRRTDSDSSWKP